MNIHFLCGWITWTGGQLQVDDGRWAIDHQTPVVWETLNPHEEKSELTLLPASFK